MTPAGTAGAWLHRHDPGSAAVRRAARVTVASCAGFYVCRYVFGDPTTAVYAVFGAVSLGALADVTGRPAQRTRTYIVALAVGVVLVALGTLLAADTAAAVAGMLVVGFVVAYAGVAGTRVAAVTNGLQLFYVLPCFPPYAPEQLGQRIVGVVVGVVLLAVADRVLWPAPAPPDVARRIADAATAAGAYARALEVAMRSGASAGDAVVVMFRDAAEQAADGLRLSDLPVSQRPAGPGVRDRSLTRVAAAVRVLTRRLTAFATLLDRRAEPTVSREASELVEAVGTALGQVGDALRGSGDAPAPGTPDGALQTFLDRRLLDATGPPPALRTTLAAEAITEDARTLVLAARGAVGAPAPDPAAITDDLWFLNASRTRLWWRRVRAHLTPRSVYLQNAVRLAVGLAVARVVAGVFDLSHGFWVLLATLSLMRTSAGASRTALRQAFAGTLAGALVAGVVLTLVGDDLTVYAVLLPVLMVAAFAAGPLLGIAAGQAGFTVVVALIFVQVAPANWQLAEVRLLDVVVGGVVGAVIGAAVWPRGGGGEIRRVAAEGLRAGADEVVATIGYLTGAGGRAEPSAALARLCPLFDHTYVQYRAEPATRDRVDWLTILSVLRRLAGYARTLRLRHPAGDPPPWPELTALARAAAADLAQGYRGIADAIEAGRPPPVGAAAAQRARLDAHPVTGSLAPPLRPSSSKATLLPVLDAWGWIDGLVDDLWLTEQALSEPTPDGPDRRPAGDDGRGARPRLMRFSRDTAAGRRRRSTGAP